MQFLPSFQWDTPLIVFLVFSGFWLVQLVFTLLLHGRLSFYRDKSATEELPPVTVVIAARNEADNIYHNLPLILTQDYPDFEVIVVNHQSVDESGFLLNAYAREFPNLKVVDIERSKHLRSGKKLPLSLGIKAAKYDKLLLTDADCKPAGDQWLRKMAGAFSSKHEIVLGYGPYLRKKGMLNAWIRFETAWVAMNYFSFALARLPYMGVGRNLAYTRSRFRETGGFKNHYALPSGDDDLFVQEAARNRNYRIVTDPDTFMFSKAKDSWSGYVQQKSRHLAASMHYRVFKKALLGIYPLSLIVMLITFVILLWNMEYRWLTLAMFVFLTVLKWWIQGRSFLKLNGRAFVPWLPFLDIIYIVGSTIIYYSIDKKAVKKWK